MSSSQKYSELAFRYASAIFDIATEKNQRAETLAALQNLHSAMTSDKAVAAFIGSPLVPAAEKVQLIQKSLDGQKISQEVRDFILVLAKKDRLTVLGEIVQAFQAREDILNNVTRGTVRSATDLDAKQKEEVQKFIDNYTKKKVVLTYEQDKSLVGGLSASVGSLTFDDSLSSHLKRIKDELNRSVV